MDDKIKHSGVIDSISGGIVTVRILQESACAACKVAGYCNASESKQKLVEVRCDTPDVYRPGQEVVVVASRGVALRATVLGFVVPLLILFGALMAVLAITGSEGLAALSALGGLALWYVLLWLFRRRIGRKVSFQIE